MRALPATVQRWVALILPPVAIAVCCFVMIPRHNRLRATERQVKVAQAGVQDYLMKLRAISDLPPDPKVASLPLTKQEQSDFLRDLAGLCYRTGNRIVSVTSLAPPDKPAAPPPATQTGAQAAAKSQGNKPPQPASGLPPDVVAIKSTIAFDGDFGSLRRFLAGLENSRRLVSMVQCRVVPGQGGYPALQTVLTVARYVDIPSSSVASSQPAGAPGAGPAS